MHTWRDDIMENTWLMEANNVIWGQRDINLEDHLQGKKVFHQRVSMRLKQSNYMKELSNVISHLMTISLYNCPAADKLHTFIIFYEALVHTNFIIWKIQELDQYILWGFCFCGVNDLDFPANERCPYVIFFYCPSLKPMCTYN